MFWGLDLLLMPSRLGCRVPAIREGRARIRMSLTHSSGTFLADVSKASSWVRTKACCQHSTYD
jgi:hypothetical protein